MNAPLLALLVLQTSPFPPSLPEKLRGLPVGLLVQHHPNPCFAVREGQDYVWRHDTTVQSLVGDLTLTEYGAYLYTEGGWRLRVALKPDLFARVYRCPGARLRRGRVYADPDNARRDARPTSGDAMWYFLARDGKGRLYKGTALIETEVEQPAVSP